MSKNKKPPRVDLGAFKEKRQILSLFLDNNKPPRNPRISIFGLVYIKHHVKDIYTKTAVCQELF